MLWADKFPSKSGLGNVPARPGLGTFLASPGLRNFLASLVLVNCQASPVTGNFPLVQSQVRTGEFPSKSGLRNFVLLNIIEILFRASVY